MNILHIIRDMSRATGGPTNALFGLAEAQVALGHRVMILATDRGGEKMVPRGVMMHVVPAYVDNWSWSPDFSRKLDELLPAVDVAHAHMVWDYPVWAAARQARRRGVPFILRPCGHLDAWSLAQKYLKKKLYLAAFGSVIHTATAIHFTSDGERNLSLAAIGDRPNFVVPLGLSQGAYTDLPSPDAFAVRFPDLRGKRIVLFLGRLHPKKQPEVTIDAFHRVVAADERLHLVLAGPAESAYGDELAARVAKLGLTNRVTFTGLLRQEAVREAYVAAEVFVLMSFQENFGIAIAEAMAAGCPVIVSDQVSLSTEISDAGAGIVCRGEVDVTVEAMVRLLADQGLRRAMGENGRSLIVRKFTWEQVSRGVVDIYMDILRKERRCSTWRV